MKKLSTIPVDSFFMGCGEAVFYSAVAIRHVPEENEPCDGV